MDPELGAMDAGGRCACGRVLLVLLSVLVNGSLTVNHCTAAGRRRCCVRSVVFRFGSVPAVCCGAVVCGPGLRGVGPRFLQGAM